MNRAKTDYLKNIELAFNNPQGIALRLSTWTSMGDWRLFFLYRDRLENVTPDAVRRVAATYLIPTNRTMGYFYPVDETPMRAEVPPTPDVEEMVAGYQGREAVAEGEAFDPSPENIDARTERTALSNGLELALLPKENRGDAVTMRFTFRMGTEDALMDRAPAASLVAPMLRRGTETHTRQEIEDDARPPEGAIRNGRRPDQRERLHHDGAGESARRGPARGRDAEDPELPGRGVPDAEGGASSRRSRARCRTPRRGRSPPISAT